MNIHRQRKLFLNKTRQRFFKALIEAAEPSIKAFENNSNSWEISQDKISKAYVLTYQIVGVYFAQITYKDLEKKYLKEDFNWLRFMENFALTKAGARITSVTMTTLDLIRKVINEAVSEGLGSRETGRKIRKKWAEISRWRAEMIARTEIVSASNQGALLGAQATGLNLKKNWLSTIDGRTRADHIRENGQQVGINEEFNVGGEMMEYPGDPDASAEQTINCRCSITFEPV